MPLLLIAILLAAVACEPNGAGVADTPESRRRVMVQEQIEKRGIKNPDVLRAMRAVPRHAFVPDELKEKAYLDQPLPIGRGQTISQPYMVAVMTERLKPSKELRVLEIGTGSGYQCAVLAELFGEVYSIELIGELGRAAEERLRGLGYRNVQVRIGDGYLGWPEKAPFDRILLTAAPPEVPEALLEQLATGGRLVAPVGLSSEDQYLMLYEKDSLGRVTRQRLGGVRFVPMVKGEAKN